MQGRLSLTTPAHVFAASPVIRKNVVEKLKVRQVETNEYEVVPAKLSQALAASLQAMPCTTIHNDTFDNLPHQPVAIAQPSTFCLLLQEIDVLVNTAVKVPAILNTSSQIVVIRHDIIQSLGVPVNYQWLIEMKGANGATNWTVGCAKDLTLQVGDVSFKVHVHVVEHASFGLLLGWPFQQASLCRFEDLPNGKVEISVCDPTNTSRRVFLSSCPRTGHAPSIKMVSVCDQVTSSAPPMPEKLPEPHPFPPLPPTDPTILVLKYKKVDKKVRPVPTFLPKEFCNIHRIPEDLLLSLPPLPTHLPNFTPSEQLTQECLDDLGLNRNNFLWPEELKLVHHILKLNECALAWTEAEKGQFRDEYFSPVKIPVIEHVPWAHKNLPIPLGILDEVIKLFKEKIDTSVYKHSDSSYRSR
jgi:hypothetical protein